MRTDLSLTRRLPRELLAEFAEDVRFSETLVERLLARFTAPGDTLLDPFAGFGTTQEVAERMGRHLRAGPRGASAFGGGRARSVEHRRPWGITPFAWDVAAELSALFRYAWDAPSFRFDHSYCLLFEHSS